MTGTDTGTPLLEEEELLEDDEVLLLLEELLVLDELDEDVLLLEVLELPVELELLELLVLEELELLDELELDEVLVELELLELELELEELLLELLELELDELLLELLEELDSSSPWVTNKPSPPQAVSAANTRLNVNERRDFVAELRKPDGNMQNTPHKCLVRVQTDIPGEVNGIDDHGAVTTAATMQ